MGQAASSGQGGAQQKPGVLQLGRVVQGMTALMGPTCMGISLCANARACRDGGDRQTRQGYTVIWRRLWRTCACTSSQRRCTQGCRRCAIDCSDMGDAHQLESFGASQCSSLLFSRRSATTTSGRSCSGLQIHRHPTQLFFSSKCVLCCGLRCHCSVVLQCCTSSLPAFEWDLIISNA